MTAFKDLNRFIDYCRAKASYKNKIASIFGLTLKEVSMLYEEIDKSEFLNQILLKAGQRKSFFNFSMSCVLRAPTLYCLCRIVRPETVVETGVADGFSSSFILEALKKNNKGKLYSIDLPNQPDQELKQGRVTGWLIPDGLKENWSLLIGSSRDKLPDLLSRLKKIDIFYHDSDHSYENMIFEFNEAIPFVRKAGLVVSDDITDNNAFRDFCYLGKYTSISLFKLGVIRKK